MNSNKEDLWEYYGVPKPSRGRKREQELKSLDKETLEKQYNLKKIFNKQAARNSRLKKKQQELKLREENEILREENETLREENSSLKHNNIYFERDNNVDFIRIKNLEITNLKEENNILKWKNNIIFIRIKKLEEEVKKLQIQNNMLYSELLKFNCFIN